ncbi:MAG: hypothetical protein OHK0047_36210 [Leptolyngbyaceae cyanobacterium]|uniref:CU044_2847 family protein n=1 Tax=Leptodesmis sichuanensis TaxID=2906798 RepID=UPI001F3FF2AD|nr:CU044_2847 family protein [Leptodesmis sichuanensis]UIE37109.1 hypothetical protein KIK02_19340 [Leptodesmis sichuanensis A121]
MGQIVPVQLEDGMVLYVEAQEEPIPAASGTQFPASATGEQTRTGQKGLGNLATPRVNPAQSMQMVQDTIRTYTCYCMKAFKNFAAADVDEVTLEFGINLSADAGIPYIASGKAQSNLKITVKCKYPNSASEVRTGAIANSANGSSNRATGNGSSY